MTFQQPFKIKKLTITQPSVFDYAILSYWNDQYGPTPRNVWISDGLVEPQDNSFEFTKKVNIIIQLILKLEVERNVSSAIVDRHIYKLTNQDVCVLAYMFSGRSRAIRGYSNCCLCFVLPSCHDDMFQGLLPLYDSLITFYLQSYRVILYRDFEAGRTIRSDKHMDELMSEVNKLTAALYKEHSCPNQNVVRGGKANCYWKMGRIPLVSNTYLRSYGKHVDTNRWLNKMKQLKKAVQASLSSFNRIVIVGAPKHTERVMKWCRTLTLLVPPDKRGLCFVEHPVQKLVPNALVQGFIHEKPSPDNCEFWEFLYRSDYPAVYFNLSRNDTLKHTPLLPFHNNRYKFTIEWIGEYFQRSNFQRSDFPPSNLQPIIKDVLDQLNVTEDMQSIKNVDTNSIADRFVCEMCKLPDSEDVRMSHLANFLTQLYGRANCMIQYIQQYTNLSTVTSIILSHWNIRSNEYLNQAKAAEGQFLSCHNFQDFEMVLSVAETLHSGVYERINIGDSMVQKFAEY